MADPQVVANIGLWANLATLVAFILNVGGIYYAARQLKVGRRATAATVLLSLGESFRQAWLLYKDAAPDAKRYVFADITNLMEIGCAVYRDKLLTGHSGDLMRDHLRNLFVVIDGSTEGREWMTEFIHNDKTFENCVRFLEMHPINRTQTFASV